VPGPARGAEDGQVAQITIMLDEREQEYLDRLLAQLRANSDQAGAEAMHRAIFVFGIRSLGQLIDQLQGSALRNMELDPERFFSEN
jgi:hypothetical protein